MQISIASILSVQLVLVLLLACGVFLYTVVIEEQSISEQVDHGEDAVSMCFDQYLDSIQTVGESFITDISLQLKSHVTSVVDDAEAKARSAATAVERTGFLEDGVMETNSWHGSKMLPSFAWMMLGQLEEEQEEKGAVVADVVVASMNSTEEFNHWVWFGLSSRNPNPTLNCDFYYYRNATNATSSLWCVEDLYQQPDQPSPSIYPHLYSPAIVKLQDATPRTRDPLQLTEEQEEGSEVAASTRRPLVWMPLNFFVWTYNVVALTSVVGGVFGRDGSLLGFAAANVRFASMSKYLNSLANSARYENLSIALIETESGKILGTSFGDAIYKENQTRSDGTTVEQELAASLGQMEHPLATALDLHIQESYGRIGLIPTPFVASATLEGQDFFLSFETFSRPILNLTICTFLPHLSITGPNEMQRQLAQIEFEDSAKVMADDRDEQLTIVIIIGVCGLVACAFVASITACYISSRIKQLVNFMEQLESKLSQLIDGSYHGSTTEDLCEPLPEDYFPESGKTRLKDLNKISEATKDLCHQLLETWNRKQEVFRQALEHRQFTASIAHDIRNLLHGVLGIVSMMQSNIEVHKDKLPLLADTLKHMSLLLNDMVDLSKIQGGKVTHVMKRFDAFATLREVRTLYQDTVVSKGGQLSCMDRCPLPPAYSDPVHVQRILTNYVSNASKYASGGEIMLKAMVATREEVQNVTFLQHVGSHFGDDAPHYAKCASLEDDQYIVLACLDKGRGIPPSKLYSVFDAYQQTVTSDRYQGAGLGLAIVKGLAVEMGGGIGVQSQVGGGSLFWLVVRCLPKPPVQEQAALFPLKPLLDTGISPLRDPNQPEQTGPLFSLARKNPLDTKLTPALGSTAPPPNNSVVQCDVERTSRVLVVDDTNLNLMLLKHFLTKLGIKCETTDNPIDALGKLRQDPDKFDLIISDFNMPEMSGGEFCLEVRKDQRLCQMPFICSSGDHLSVDEKDKYKIDDALMKPFTVDRLQETMEPWMHRPSKWSDTPPVESHAPGVFERGA